MMRLSNNTARTLLHVEDDAALAQLVRTAFASFGFRGEILRASLVGEALALLAERERKRESLDLVLVDMKLPDGSGLDVLRQVKGSPLWRRTPVIVLSGETAPGIVDEAYALGANCYLPKISRTKGALGSIQALYQCWIEGALLPHPAIADGIQESLARGVRLRARTADFFVGVARDCGDPDEEEFWVNRALVEGNLSNLLAFFQGQISERDVPAGAAERIALMQRRVERALCAAEESLAMRPSPAPAEICRWALELVEAWDEGVFAEVIGALFPRSPAVTLALKERAVCQLRDVACHVRKQSQEPELNRRAQSLLAFAGRLAGAGVPLGCSVSD